MPSTAESAAPRIVISNVTGINAGQLLNGRPPTLIGYETFEIQYCSANPPVPPASPPISVINGTIVLWRPSASGNPSTGNGV